MKSECFAGSVVSFPKFTGERVYMHAFTPSIGLPKELERWQETVDAMLIGVNAPGSVYLMIDQAEVIAGTYHRRPGLHVDGYWCADNSEHAPLRKIINKIHNSNTPQPLPSKHSPIPKRSHQPIPPKHSSVPRQSHEPIPTRHSLSSYNKETLILASNVVGCEAYEGEWDGVAGLGGDCDSIDRSGLKRVVMWPGIVWLGETGSMLHESMPLDINMERTVVRLNVPGWSPN